MIDVINGTTFVAFDLETTGLTPVVDRIVEIGAVRFCGNQVIDTFDELVDPLRPISHGASSVNGITDESLRKIFSQLNLEGLDFSRQVSKIRSTDVWLGYVLTLRE